MACSCSRSVDISSLRPSHTNTSLQLGRARISLVHNNDCRKLQLSLQTSSWLGHSSPAERLTRKGRDRAEWVALTSSWHGAAEKSTQKRGRAVRASEEDFEIEEMIEFDDDDKEEEEEELQDFETDYDVGKLGDNERHHESDSFISTRGEAAESIVNYKINEDEFHKLSLQHCDFFIRKVPDPDNDVYDFREMYVTAPDTDIYAIPRADGKLPKRPVRLMKSKFEHICVTEIPVESLRAPMVKDEKQVMKIFLMKHFKNRRADAWNFVVDFEQIYVIDSKAKSISRAKVTLNVPSDVNRDRSQEILLVHDDGTTFTVIPQSKRKTPDQLVYERNWNKTKKDMDNYLRSFRDYPISNWF